MNTKNERIDAIAGHTYPVSRFDVHYWNFDATPQKWTRMRSYSCLDEAQAFVRAYPEWMRSLERGPCKIGEAATVIRIVHIKGTATVVE